MLKVYHIFCFSTSIAKVNNFSRLRPSLKLLGVSYNINIAQDVMKEKLDVVTNLLYQLYVALKEKKSPGGGRAAMQPIARVQLHKEEHGPSSIVRTLNRCLSIFITSAFRLVFVDKMFKSLTLYQKSVVCMT